ncbi:arrestin domain-containing protein 3-like [Scleropages formosus]|uniref:arrestin domain-containing protein 3-like n=1 Tax=Scleropages formosus TaxID=113540 RepID=UPI000878F733|nr:arrestin domain-containing protein 3-like [Scleropages formosus]
MSNSVKSISVSYNPVNKQNTFSNGDVLAGRVVVVIAKETKIKTLLVKVRGKAEVFWTEQQGYRIDIYDAKQKCLKLDKILLSPKKDEGDIVLAPGSHAYPFIFQLPQGRLPSSFTGEHGSIQYKVEAKLSRSWRIPSRAISPFMFLSKVDLSTHQLMLPQQGIITKTFKVFTSGNVTFKVNLDKSSFRQGETVKVRVEVSNGTSREITPKFCVTQKQNFFASGKRKLHKNTVLKAAGEPVPAKSEQTHVRMVSLPHDLSVSILNCDILKVEYKIRVYLDIPYAINPELKMPIVILPASYVSHSAAKTKQPGPVRVGLNPSLVQVQMQVKLLQNCLTLVPSSLSYLFVKKFAGI